MSSDWRKIIEDDVRRTRHEVKLPWWYGWIGWEDVPALLIVLAVAFFFACLLWGPR